MFHCFTFFLLIRFCILRLSLNTPALCPSFHGVSPQGEEKFYQPFVWDNMVGSPPHGRGKGGCSAPGGRDGGITPAWAEKRLTRPAMTGTPRDHPRVGGEKRPAEIDSVASLGSPPHGQGKDKAVFRGKLQKGITPAWAGKRGSGDQRGGRNRNHPRVGGEKPFLFYGGSSDSGSPPHGRGKVRTESKGGTERGITPAWAGKRRKVHPHQ